MTAEAKQGAERETIGRLAVDLAVLIAIGLLMGFLGPFGSAQMPVVERHVYWMICMVGGGLIGVFGDELIRPWVRSPWPRTALVSVVMTPAVAVLVLTTEHLLTGEPFRGSGYLRLLWQVLPILAAVMAVRTLVWRRTPARIETRTVIAPPLPEAEAAFRRRLSARRRQARLIAIEAHDHYLKVHTDAGIEMITLRFADALKDLSRAHGWRVHRSWWVAADAVEGVRWRRGGGDLRLVGDLIVPISRTHAPILKEAGWF